MRDDPHSAAVSAHLESGAAVEVVLDHRIRLSIAISLKRIADALTGEGPSILTAPLNQYGETLGDTIQGQLERGQR